MCIKSTINGTSSGTEYATELEQRLKSIRPAPTISHAIFTVSRTKATEQRRRIRNCFHEEEEEMMRDHGVSWSVLAS